MVARQGGRSIEVRPRCSLQPDERELDALNTDTELNSQQIEAVSYTGGPLLVLAGAGTGKTRTLAHRAAYLIRERLATPHVIVAITFTRKAAGEMAERLQILLGEDVEDLQVTTFHSLCYRMLLAEGVIQNGPPRGAFRRYGPILPDDDSFRLVRQAMKETGLPKARWDVTAIHRHIMQAKDRFVTPEAYVTVPGDYVQEAITRVYRLYQAMLERREQIDYADLIRLAVKLLEENGDARRHYQELARHLLVDEFQDTSYSQHRLVSLLGGLHRNVFAVGSPAQGIYGWRGADPTQMVSLFTQAFPDARVLKLEQHYRSTRTILAATRAIGNGHADTELRTANPAGERITVARLADEMEEARFVVDTVGDLQKSEGVCWSDVAVLFRVRRQATPLEQFFIQHGIPYQVTAGNTFFKREDVRRLLAYLRLADDPFDARSLSAILNVPPRGIGPVTRKKLMGAETQFGPWMICNAEDRMDIRPGARAGLVWLADFLNDVLPRKAAELPPQELLAFIIQETGYDRMLDDAFDAHRRWANVREFLAMASRYETLDKLLGKVDELEDETLESEYGVVLSTIHGAKGLEFPVVFVIGMEDGILPLGKNGSRDAEERRVFYVAMTRARERLFLTCVRTRRDYQGRAIKSAPSPFLREIPSELTERRRLKWM